MKADQKWIGPETLSMKKYVQLEEYIEPRLLRYYPWTVKHMTIVTDVLRVVVSKRFYVLTSSDSKS